MVVAVRTDIDKAEPWQSGTLLQVRTGRIKPAFGMPRSAIFKTPKPGLIKITKLGCEGDQQAFHEHGGVDKALLWFCVDHYAEYKTEMPDNAHLFTAGGFGENLVTTTANERNICIGDKIQIGEEVIVEISEPRQPCYMLNHRFEVKDMSSRAQRSGRTGWYLRVIKEGHIQAGDSMILVDRPHPTWTVSQIQHYLYSDTKNADAMQEMLDLAPLGDTIKQIFRNRIQKQLFEDEARRLEGPDHEKYNLWSDYRLAKRHTEAEKVSSLTFEAILPLENPIKAMPGSHVRLQLGQGLVRAYSVVSGDENRFELGIAQAENSRGGSEYLCQKLVKGDTLQISKMTSSFPLAPQADRHIFIAGGIGITAFIESAQLCEASSFTYHLHYLVRNEADIAFKRYLDLLGKNVTIYVKNGGSPCDLSKIFNKMHDQVHVYCCGSERLMTSVAEQVKMNGIKPGNAHYEAFVTSTSGDPFTVELAESNQQYDVKENETLLDVLKNAGMDIASSCEVGNCGTCRVAVKCGKVEHRGTGLIESEKEGSMLSCVSRGIGHIVLDM